MFKGRYSSIWGNVIFRTKDDALNTIDDFKKNHPNSKKKFRIIKKIEYFIEEI